MIKKTTSTRDLNDHRFDRSNWSERKHNQKHRYQWKIELKRIDSENLNARTWQKIWARKVLNRHWLSRRWLFCTRLLSFFLSWLSQKNLIFSFKIEIDVWIDMIRVWFIDDVHWIETIIRYWIKIIHLNNSFFRFRTICCNMILFMTIKTNVFVNIFLFTIIDDATKKNKKLKCINQSKKEWNESFWRMKTNQFIDFLNLFLFASFSRHFITIIYTNKIYFNFFQRLWKLQKIIIYNS